MARGSVVKRGNCYYVVYRIGGKQKWEPAGRRKKDADRILAKRMAAIADGALRELRKVTFSEFADLWLDEYATTRVRQSTLESYRSVIENHLKPFFGDRGLRSITMRYNRKLWTG